MLDTLQRSAGNKATTGVVQRESAPSVQRAISAADAARLRAAESSLDAVSAATGQQSTQFGALSDTSLDKVNAGRTHLTASNTAYTAGHKLFTDVLAKADAEHATNEAIEGAVQGILVAAALAVIAPEAILVTGVLRAAASSTSSRLVTAGLSGLVAREAAISGVRGVEGAIGEVGEMAAGAVVDSAKSPGAAPGTTAGLAGPSVQDKFVVAFGQLDGLVAAMPRIGAMTAAAGSIARAAEQLARESMKLRLGETAKWSVDEVVQKAQLLEQLRDQAAESLTRATSLAARVTVLSEQITGTPTLQPTDIEDRLWTSWMAALGTQHDLLDNDVIEEYLGPKGKGMLDFGSYTSETDERDAVSSAQVRWLQQNGITPGPNPSTQYLAETAVRRVRAAVVGKRGTITGPRTVQIDGTIYTYAQNAGALPQNTEVVALHVVAPASYQTGQVNIAEVTDRDVDVYCNRADETDAASRGLDQAPAPISAP